MKIKRTAVIDYQVKPFELRQARDKSGDSLSRFAQRLGVSRAYWYKVEWGNATPGMAVFRRACTLLWGTTRWNEIKNSAKVVSD